MKKTKGLNLKEAAALLLSMLLILLVFVTGRLDKQKTWGTMEFLNMEFIKQDKKNPHYGIQNTGPSFNLPAGEYTLKFSVETDGGGCVRLVTTNDAPIEPNEFSFTSGQGEQVVKFRILESAKQMDVQVDFESGTYFKMGETRLYTPFYRDNAFTLTFAVVLFWMLYFRKKRGMTQEQWFAFLLITAAILFASAPALKEDLTIFHDTRYHSARLRNLADGLASGQFPVRLGGFSYNGYGAITSVFYPDLLLTPFALLLLAGCSLQYVMNLLLIAGNVLAACTMYSCARRILKQEKLALIASILYVLSVYHVTDGSVRYALGELMAMGFVPIFLTGLWEVIWGEKQRWRTLAAGAALIFMSHMLSTFLCVLLALALCVPMLPKLIRERRISGILKAAVFACFLCLFQILPLLTYMRQGIGADASLFTTTMASTAMSPAQFFLLGAGNLSAVPKDTTVSFMPLELGLPLWIGVLLAVSSLKLRPSAEEQGEHRAAFLFLLAGGFFSLMSTTWFPWNYVSVVTGLFDKVQFAYRYLMFPALLFSLLGAWGCREYVQGKAGRIACLAAFALCVISILPTISAQTRLDESYPFGTDVSPDIKQFTEYCIPGVDMTITRTRKVETEGDVLLENAEKLGSRFTAEVVSENGGTVTLPLFGFDGYAAVLNGSRMEVSCTKEGKLQVALPSASKGQLRVWFEGKTYWRLGDVVSLLSWLWLVAGFVLKKRHQAE